MIESPDRANDVIKQQRDAKASVDIHNEAFLAGLTSATHESVTAVRDSNSAPSKFNPGFATFEISKMPKLGDVFEIAVTAQYYNRTDVTPQIRIIISEDIFEFVNDLFSANTEFRSYNGRTTAIFYTDPVNAGQLNGTVRAISEGYGAVWGGALVTDTQEPYRIYIDKENSFFYDENKLRQRVTTEPQYGISYADLVKLQERAKTDSSLRDQTTVYDSSVPIPPNLVGEDAVKSIFLDRINWADYRDDKNWVAQMPRAETLKISSEVPDAIGLGTISAVNFTLQSVNRLNDYEHVKVDVIPGPGLALVDAYHGDVFDIGPENSTSIQYGIMATQPGTWMLNFKFNDAYERYLVVVGQ